MTAPDLQTRLIQRHRAVNAIRSFFAAQDFVEVDTPMLVPGTGLEPHIDPIEVWVKTTFDGAPVRRYLHTSPELALKRVLSRAGLPRVMQLARVFRDGERTERHLPEFTLLEWYRTGAGLDALVEDCQQLFAAVATALHVEVEWAHAPFVRTDMQTLFAEHAGIDLGAALTAMRDGDADALVNAAQDTGLALRPRADFEDAFFAVMEKCVEPALPADRAVVVERFPAQMAVLSKLCDDDDRYADRFEIYAGGFELANAFDELTDAEEQRARFERDNQTRVQLGKDPLAIDDTFLTDLASMPAAVGIAVGVDRLLMALLGHERIDDVVGLPWR